MDDVLIVDDDRTIVEMVSAALAMEGVPYRVAHDGAEALSLAAAARPAVILLDVNMPVMDGPRFCAAFDQQFGRGDTVVVIMTAGRDAWQICSEVGATTCLPKPFDLNALYRVVERCATVE